MSARRRKSWPISPFVVLAAVLLTATAPSALSAQFLGVFPDGQQSQQSPNSGPIGLSFGVSGTQSGNTYFIDMYCDGIVVTGCSSDIGSSFTGARSSIPVTIWTGGVGTGRVRIKVYKSGGTPSDSGWYNVTVVSPYQPATLVVSQYGNVRDASRCVASCFENVQAYSTPAYTSMDVARSVTLQYRSGQAHPLGTVQIDATDYSSTPADSLSLLLQRLNGSYVTFTNGSQEIFFRAGVANGTTRLAAQFDASAQVTNDSTYTAIVKSYWHNGTVQQASLAVRVMVINESTSPYGAGWAVAGVQRVYPQTDGGVVVVDGSGSAAFFSGSCVPSTSCTFTSPAGDFSTLSTGNTAYKRHYPDGTDYNFTSDGFASSVTDRFGNPTRYTFQNSGISMITDPAAAAVFFGYDQNTGKLSSISAGGSRLSTFSVDGNGNLQSVTDPDNICAFQATYTGPHQLMHWVDRHGGAWDYTYAVDGTLQTVQEPTITASGSQTRPTPTFSGPSTQIFNAIINHGAGSASNPVARGIDLRATVTNPRGYSTNYTLGFWGSPTLVQDALLRNETFGYDPNSGQLTSHTAVSGRQSSYIWYGPELVQITDGPKTVHIEYGETMFNQPTHIYGDVSEQWMTYNTNQTGRPLLTSRVAGQGATTYSFDSSGRILSQADTLGHVTYWYYQTPIYTLANTDSMSQPGLLATSYSRDAYGRVIATRHPDGTTDSTYYDLLNRDTTDVDGSLHRTKYTYDAVFLQGVTDPNSQQYSFVRNALGWVEQELRPGSAVALLTAYDKSGNVISTTNRQGGVVSHVLDPLDRDTLITADGQSTRITYGPNDQWLRYINGEGTDSLVADAYGRYTQANTSRPASGGTYSITYSLTNDDLLNSFSVTSNRWSGTRGPSFTYDSTKNVKTLTSFAGTSTITWNRDGLPTQLQYPNGLTATSAFTSDHDVVSMIFSSSVSGAWFLRDSLGRIAGRSPQNFADASGFSYNADGSLKHWSLAPQGGNCQTFNPSYGYECLVGIPTQETDYTYDNVGNVTSGGASYAANRLTAANGYSMTYDEDGNLKSKSGSGFSQTLNWNSLGQLTSVTTNGTTTTFGYDGLGRRVRKSVNGGATTGYLYSGDNLYLELDSNGNPVTEYAYWPSVDAPNAISKGGQSYYLTQDPQSANITSVVRASDNSVQASYDYTPFGTLRSGWFDNVGNSLQFAARQYDTETGLIYFRARYYDPQVARFVSEDPLGLGGGINPYVYAGNDPINASDPSGLAVEDGSDCTSKTLPGGGIEVDCPKNKGGGSPTPANPQGPGPVVSDPPAPGGGGSPLGAGSADNGQTVPVSYKPVKQCSAMMSLLVNQLRAQQSAASSEGLERGGIVRYLLDGTLVASRSELPGSRAPRRVSVVWDARGTADWHVHLFRRPGQGPSNLDTLSTMISGHSFLVGPDSAFEMWRDGNHVERTGCQP